MLNPEMPRHIQRCVQRRVSHRADVEKMLKRENQSPIGSYSRKKRIISPHHFAVINTYSLLADCLNFRLRSVRGAKIVVSVVTRVAINFRLCIAEVRI